MDKNVLSEIQAKLKAPKSQWNNFGKYNYRSCEDILEAVKPILYEMGLGVVMTDEIINMSTRFYVQSTAVIIGENGQPLFSATAMAREADEKKGMDAAQITGAASSYARKYALAGLLAIDDNKDVDGLKEAGPKTKDPIPKEEQVPYNVKDLSPKPLSEAKENPAPAIKGKEKVDPRPDLVAIPIIRDGASGESKVMTDTERQLAMFEEVFPGSGPVEDRRIIDGCYNTPANAPAGVLYFEKEANSRFLSGVGSAETLDAFMLDLQKQSNKKGKGKTLDQLKVSVMEKDGFEKIWTLYLGSLEKKS